MSILDRVLVRLMWKIVPHSLIEYSDELRVGMLDYLPALVSQFPSHGTRLAVYRRLGARLAPRTEIQRGCQFYYLPGIEIGANTVINQGVVLDGRRGLSIGRNVSISEQVIIYTQQHVLDDPEFGVAGGSVFVGDRVFIGARAIIMPGVTLGEGSVVAAGSVVMESVAPYLVVGGVPSKPIKRRSSDLTYTLLHRRRFY